jgi:uncharacterized membrane protein YqjE
MDTPQQVPEHDGLTIFRVALSWLGLILMLWGIVCAFRLYICGAVLAAIGAASCIEAVRKMQIPLILRHQTEKQTEKR